VDLGTTIDTLLVIAAVAAATPLLVALLPWLRVPQVVLLIAGGIVVGPEVLGFGSPGSVQVLSDLGLGFVFLLAGYEVEVALFASSSGRRAIASWFISAAVAAGVVGALGAAGVVHAYVPVAIGLTTTALGTLLPILREHDLLRGRLGRHLIAAGAVGELFPILAVALFLGIVSRFVALLSVLSVVAIAFVLSAAHRLVGRGRLLEIVRQSQHETSQAILRCTVLLLMVLLAATNEFHLDAVLGAFIAGMVLRRWAGASAPLLEDKLDAIGYGFFIPIFFVYSGMTLDIRSIADAPLRVVLFLALMVAVRGLPALLVYRGVLPRRERLELVLITATSLPLLVALAEIGRRNGTMLPENAAALVGAGVLSVLILPSAAIAVRKRGRAEPAEAEPADSEPADAEPADAEPADSEPADSEPADSEPAESTRADSAPADSDRADSGRAGAEPPGAEPAGTEPAGTEPAGTEPAGTEPAGTEPAGTEPAGAEPAEPAGPGQVGR
jgi:Kef-type K+ transport system membrane component KefB